MARIMHVITALETGGAEMMLLKLLSSSNGRHSQAVVSLTDEGTAGARIAALGVPIHSLGLRKTAPSPLRALAIRRLIRQFRPQLIQGWMYHGNLMASIAARWEHNHVPVIWGIHQSLYGLSTERWLTAVVIRVDALISRQATRIIYVSATSKKQHEAFGYDASKGVVIPNGLDCQMFAPDGEARLQVRSELGVEQDTILVGLVARYHPMKDHAGFLRAAALVARTHPSARFALIGRHIKEQPALRALVARLRLQDHVLLLGERPDMPRLTPALDIACSASAWGESFSLATGEAMACGVPCVVTDVGDSAYIIGDTGLCVPPKNPEALAQAILQLISAGPERRRQLGAAARCRIQDKFSLPAIVHQYEDLYREHLSPAI